MTNWRVVRGLNINQCEMKRALSGVTVTICFLETNLLQASKKKNYKQIMRIHIFISSSSRPCERRTTC